jgi:GTP-binding protein
MNPGPDRAADARIATAEFEAGAPSRDKLPDPTVDEVAFVGRSNVGKSSVMNTLVDRRNLVRTSSTPGCTRQINLFSVTLAGGRSLRLVDLPGYGYAKLSKAERAGWGARLEDYVQARTALCVVVLVIDARRGFERDDAQMAEFLLAPRPCGPPPRLVVVATKLDKLPRSKQKPLVTRLENDATRKVIGFSAMTGEGRGSLWAAILDAPLRSLLQPAGSVAVPDSAAGALATSGGVE